MENIVGYTVYYLKKINETNNIEIAYQIIPITFKDSFEEFIKNNNISMPTEDEFNDWYINQKKYYVINKIKYWLQQYGNRTNESFVFDGKMNDKRLYISLEYNYDDEGDEHDTNCILKRNNKLNAEYMDDYTLIELEEIYTFLTQLNIKNKSKKYSKKYSKKDLKQAYEIGYISSQTNDLTFKEWYLEYNK